jgi:hypothetical protein
MTALTDKQKAEVTKAVKLVIKKYHKTLERLAKV